MKQPKVTKEISENIIATFRCLPRIAAAAQIMHTRLSGISRMLALDREKNSFGSVMAVVTVVSFSVVEALTPENANSTKNSSAHRRALIRCG